MMKRIRKIAARPRIKEIVHRPDYLFLGTAVFLLALGLLTLFSASTAYGQEKFGDMLFFIKKQALFGLIPGLFLGATAYLFPLKYLKKISFPAAFLLLISLFLVFAPGVGVTIGGAARWVSFSGVTFQPSEFFKLGFILYSAAIFSKFYGGASARKRRGIEEAEKNFSLQRLTPFLIFVGLSSAALILQPDAGTLGVILITGLALYFVSGAPIVHFIGATGLIAGLGVIIIKASAYRLERLAVFWDPKIDPLGIGYQINQALIALGSGGIAGLGITMSRQKFGFIPQPVGDSIFAIYGEEFGFVGSVLLIALFIFFVTRGFSIAGRAPNAFQRLTVTGIAIWIGAQAFINIGAMTGLVPLTGIPLPFFSYGGSAMAAILAGVGIVLNISRHTV